MRAITARFEPEEAAIAAIRAGIDLLIVSNFERADPQLPNKLVGIGFL
jgi:beta-glucosidase-like glycosyl hydrolase